MKLRNLFMIVVCVFGPVTAHAENNDTPELLSAITGNVEILSDTENAKLRGEYYWTINGAINKCRSVSVRCVIGSRYKSGYKRYTATYFTRTPHPSTTTRGY